MLTGTVHALHEAEAADSKGEVLVSRVHARVGLLGNPSDGFFGKTLSFSLSNFYAEVTLIPADAIELLPHPEHDATHYNSYQDMLQKVETQGFYGGIRLLMAICKRFYEHCAAAGLQLPNRGFKLSYDTNIPRQAGLSGSSAIICAGLNCLIQYFEVSETVLPVQQRPSLVLSAESELGITAGLQDRVIQVYGGIVYMDFELTHMQKYNRGLYESLEPSLLPRLWLIYCDCPSDSGRVHSTVKQRWLAGDEDVIQGMQKVAECAEKGRVALLQQDVATLANLMDRNFDLRRSMFGDAALGEVNLAMIRTARSVGAAAKFTGSGGAIIALCPNGTPQEQQLKDACAAAGYHCILAEVAQAIHKAEPTTN